MGVSGVPDIRESGPTGYPGYLRDIRDIRNQDQGWGYQVPSLISLIQHRLPVALGVAVTGAVAVAFRLSRLLVLLLQVVAGLVL